MGLQLIGMGSNGGTRGDCQGSGAGERLMAGHDQGHVKKSRQPSAVADTTGLQNHGGCWLAVGQKAWLNVSSWDASPGSLTPYQCL